MNEHFAHGGKLYEIIRKIRVSHVGDNMEGLKMWRDKNNCDHVLKVGEYYALVRTITDVEWEEVKEEELTNINIKEDKDGSNKSSNIHSEPKSELEGTGYNDKGSDNRDRGENVPTAVKETKRKSGKKKTT
jgi:CTP:phosphocholine cytidylyltransferase-like protein